MSRPAYRRRVSMASAIPPIYGAWFEGAADNPPWPSVIYEPKFLAPDLCAFWRAWCSEHRSAVPPADALPEYSLRTGGLCGRCADRAP
jgi:hypothetical protein